VPRDAGGIVANENRDEVRGPDGRGLGAGGRSDANRLYLTRETQESAEFAPNCDGTSDLWDRAVMSGNAPTRGTG
jgi:hypothetical protein